MMLMWASHQCPPLSKASMRLPGPDGASAPTAWGAEAGVAVTATSTAAGAGGLGIGTQSGSGTGNAFAGGTAQGFVFVLGEGRMLPDFEAAAQGMRAGESKAFELKFPDDYQSKDVAGKISSFRLSLGKLEEAHLPGLDAEFAKSLGVEDGDLDKMRVEVKSNVEREVAKRVKLRMRAQALQALLDTTSVDVPKVLVEMETQGMFQKARADLEARGVNLDKLPFEASAFEAGAKRRVTLSLIVSELEKTENLKPKPDQVRKLIDEQAESYEKPSEVVKWFYMQPQRLNEMEGLALEQNVIDWVLAKAKVVDKGVPFDELMASAA